jgi:hypothetical protein
VAQKDDAQKRCERKVDTERVNDLLLPLLFPQPLPAPNLRILNP